MQIFFKIQFYFQKCLASKQTGKWAMYVNLMQFFQSHGGWTFTGCWTPSQICLCQNFQLEFRKVKTQIQKTFAHFQYQGSLTPAVGHPHFCQTEILEKRQNFGKFGQSGDFFDPLSASRLQKCLCILTFRTGLFVHCFFGPFIILPDAHF